MIETDVTSGTASAAPHSVPELEQIAAAERELKRRGRRRLIGAGTLGLLGVIFLPMFFDTEPRGEKTRPVGAGKTTEINITIPQREGLSPLPPPVLPSVVPSPSTKPGVAVESTSAAKMENSEPKISGSAVALGAAAVGAAVVGVAAVASEKTATDKITPKPALVPPKSTTAAVVVPPPSAVPPVLPVAKVVATPPVAVPALPPKAAPAAVAAAKPVAAATIAPATQPTSASTSAATAGGFVVQLGAFSDDYNIRTLTERMKSGKLPVYAEKIQITSAGKPKTVTRLRVGPYPTMEKAKLISAKVKALGVTNTVVAK